MTNNVIYRTYESAIVMTGKNNIIDKNLVVSVYWSGEAQPEFAEFNINNDGAIMSRDAISVVMKVRPSNASWRKRISSVAFRTTWLPVLNVKRIVFKVTLAPALLSPMAPSTTTTTTRLTRSWLVLTCGHMTRVSTSIHVSDSNNGVIATANSHVSIF